MVTASTGNIYRSPYTFFVLDGNGISHSSGGSRGFIMEILRDAWCLRYGWSVLNLGLGREASICRCKIGGMSCLAWDQGYPGRTTR